MTRGRKDLWKGIHDDDSIEFRLSDKVFLENVYQHIIKFGNGTYINCKMTITTTSSSIDEKEKISRVVSDVINWGDDENNIRTVVKRKSKNIQSTDDNLSLNLFSGID